MKDCYRSASDSVSAPEVNGESKEEYDIQGALGTLTKRTDLIKPAQLGVEHLEDFITAYISFYINIVVNCHWLFNR